MAKVPGLPPALEANVNKTYDLFHTIFTSVPHLLVKKGRSCALNKVQSPSSYHDPFALTSHATFALSGSPCPHSGLLTNSGAWGGSLVSPLEGSLQYKLATRRSSKKLASQVTFWDPPSG